MAKYETALGGKANLDKITSRTIKAQRVELNGKTFETEEVLQKGAKMSVTTVYESKQGNYTVKEIYDGTMAAKFGNGAKIDLKTDETEQIKREAQLFANPNLKTIYSKTDFRFVDKIDGREVFFGDGNNRRQPTRTALFRRFKRFACPPHCCNADGFGIFFSIRLTTTITKISAA